MEQSSSTAGDSPLVSVIIPAYNVTAYIAEAIDSVLQQEFKSFEIIVVNDGCPDSGNLEQVLQPYREQGRIRYVRQQNKGLAGARNTGIRNARAPFVALLDADDVCGPRFLPVLHGLLQQYPEASMAFANAIYFGDSRYSGQKLLDLYPPTVYPLAGFMDLVQNRCLGCGCSMVRREAAEHIGLYDEELRSAEDFDFNLRISRLGKIVYTKDVLWQYRQRADSLSKSPRIGYWRVKVLEKTLGLPDLTPEERTEIQSAIVHQRAKVDREYGRFVLVHGDVKEGIEHLSMANGYYRSPRLTAMIQMARIAPGLLRAVGRWRDRRA